VVFSCMLAVAEQAWHQARCELDLSPNTLYNLTTGLVPKDKLAKDYYGFLSALGCRELSKLRKLGKLYHTYLLVQQWMSLASGCKFGIAMHGHSV
jgi:hypothetical protein